MGEVPVREACGVIDMTTHKLVQTIAVGRSPHGLYFAERAPVVAPNPD
ncbi:hypothetical protein B0G77_2688 [Paraburkholderia sp. BL10I2N1]|nr:hypothetical protein B0G77_2688 [Paraburkholderia sp. BL10I2N1]